MKEPFLEMLRGDSNTLGRTEEVTTLVLEDPTRASEVYELFFQDDTWVRLRAASVSKRLWRADEELFQPFVDGWIERVSTIDQPSSQWTFAQFCEECDHLLTDDQRNQAIKRVHAYLMDQDDWMVLNSSIAALAMWAQSRTELADSIRPRLEQLANDDRKSVAKRATKALNSLSGA